MGAASTHQGKLLRRVGVIGDVHTERARLQGALACLRALEPDAILCTGDLPDGPHDAAEVEACCELLRAHGVLTVRGNHDRWLLDDEQRDLPGATLLHELKEPAIAFLRSLPETVELLVPGGPALLCHGLGNDDMAELRPHDHAQALADNAALQALLGAGRLGYVIGGHTHQRMLRAISGLTVINAGTLLSDHEPGCMAIDFEKRELTWLGLGAGGEVTGRELERF